MHQNPIVLGMSAPFEGNYKGLGIELYRGAQAYFEEVNKSEGGINGRSIELIALNDDYNPDITLPNTIELVEKYKVLALFGYVGTPTLVRVLPILRYWPITLFFPFTGAQPQREVPFESSVYNLRSSYRQETEGLVDLFFANGWRRIGVLFQNDDYGRSGWDGIRRAIYDKYGGKYGDIITLANYIKKDSSFASSFQTQVQTLLVEDVDAVIAIGAYGPCAGFVRDLRRYGSHIPVANVSFVGSDEFLEHLRWASREDGCDYTSDLLINSEVVPNYATANEVGVLEYRKVMDAYNMEHEGDELNSKFPYSFGSLEGFFNAKVLVTILKNMDDLDNREELSAMTEALGSIDIGISEPVIFSPHRHQGLDKVYYNIARDEGFFPIDTTTRI